MSKSKVLVVGWDAADWRVINPLVDAGKMPGVQRIIELGVMGNLASLYPPLSPMVWTSIGTGKRPTKHGILGFSEPTADGSGVQPISVLSRRGKAVWNILNQEGYRSNVVAWWPSHPVEPINGVMVSNHYHQAPTDPRKPWPMLSGTVHPNERAEELANLRFHPRELTQEHILPFIPRAADVDQTKDRRISSCLKIIGECTSVHSAATHLMTETEWDFMVVYYDAIDHFSHGFMKYHPPRHEFIREEDYLIYKDVVTAGYLYHDMMLRTLMQLAPPETTIILVSDHGFHPDHMRPSSIPNEPAGPAIEHRDFGVIAMAGPGIKKDERIYGASLLDVTPTILTLCGLPVGEDMDGRPLVEAFEEPPNIELIPSWDEVEGDDGCHPPDKKFDPFEAKEALEQLVALGYIEKPDANREKSIAKTVRELNYNLARSYMDASLHGEAVPLLTDLYIHNPSDSRFGIHLAMCYRALDRIPELSALVEDMKHRRVEDAKTAQEGLKKFAEMGEERKQQRAQEKGEEVTTEDTEEKDDELFSEEEKAEIKDLRSLARFDAAALEFLGGCVQVAEGNLEAAIASLKKAEKRAPQRLAMHIHVGEAYLQLKNWEDATRAFRKAIKIDPENAHAQLGLARSLLLRRKNKMAARVALKAIGLMYHYPLAHYALAVALHRIGQVDRALEALRVALSQNPNFAEAHDRAAYIYEYRKNDAEQAKYHKAQARELRAARRSRAAQSAFAALPVPVQPDEQDSKVEQNTSQEQAAKRVPRLGNTPAEVSDAELVPEAGGEPITIVSGLPRSGTSMMMQMLDGGGLPILSDGEREADEDNPRGYLELEGTKRLRTDHSWLADAQGHVVKVIAQLIPVLPLGFGYRVIFMERDIVEVLSSQRHMLERLGEQGANLSDDRLRTVFVRQVRQVRAALRAHDVPTCYVAYGEAVEDPAEVARKVNEFLGGGLDVEAMAASVDPSLYRQRISSEASRRA